MSGDETFPATVGQLSVWRDLDKIPPERRWEANLTFIWDLPPGHWDAGDVWAALGAIGMRHGSLRTMYVAGADGFPRQRLTDDTAESLLEQVRQGTADVADRAATETAELQRAIDPTVELPWRAWILTDAGEPTQVLIVIHHLAADGPASLVMQDDFVRYLTGEESVTDPVPAPGPLEMALDQQGGGSGRLRTAERYWRRTLAAAPRLLPDGPAAEVVGATVHTGIPMPMAHDGAAKLEVSPASVLLTAYYRALCSVTGRTAHLLFPMSSNRFEERQAMVVTSLNQWAPLVLDLDPDEPFAALASKVHWKTFNALKNGVCSPDAIMAVRAEQEGQEPPVDPGYYYNPMLAPPGFPSTDAVAKPSVEWAPPARATGPGFYVIGRGLASLNLTVRINRPGWDRPAVERFVAALLQDLTTHLL